MALSRHCEPTGRREAPPDDKLREAIQLAAQRTKLDCFVASLLAMTKNQVFVSAFFETNTALRLSISSTFTPFLRMM